MYIPLLAALDRALVRALASVDPAVSRQAGRLHTDRLASAASLADHRGGVGGGGAYIREAFSAAKVFALVRLLSSVGADVYSEGAALDEGLATVVVVADVWALICMYAVVTLQIRLSVETLFFFSLAFSTSTWGKVYVCVVCQQEMHD